MGMSLKTVDKNQPVGPRGFLLLVVVGILAVLLVVCIGFLSFSRGEMNAVATIRDKSDCNDIIESAKDWMLANISKDLFDGTGKKVDPNKYISFARNAGGLWWYRPYENNMRNKFAAWNVMQYPYTWGPPGGPSGDPGICPPCVDKDGRDEAVWTYLPQDYFPQGGVRGRFMISVLDANAFVNLNDWLDDCNPTQCQMAHMFMDGYGEQELERYRSWRDGSAWDRTPSPNRAPVRYQEAWRVVSRTVRFTHWPYSYDPAPEKLGNMLSWNWVTTNTSWLSLYGAEMTSLKPSIVCDGFWILNSRPSVQPTVNKYYPPTPNEGFLSGVYNSGSLPQPGYPDFFPGGYMQSGNQTIGRMPFNMPFSVRSNVDPDTGRCPVNVNTCYNSGEKLPTNIFGGTPCFTMEAVFNVESLRRIIQVGNFSYPGGTANGSDGSLMGAPMAAKLKCEQLKMKLAYQYQEALCRYFTGTYRHSMKRKWPPLYNPVTDVPEDFSDDGTYAAVYGTAIGCASNDYSKTRFPVDLVGFRKQVHDDLLRMSLGMPLIVDFNPADVPTVIGGMLDKRTAAAVYDNIVPGKPLDLNDFGPVPGDGDPLTELYNMQIGRDELREDPCESDAGGGVFGYYPDNAVLKDSGNSTWAAVDPTNENDDPARWLNLRPKGKDIAKSGMGGVSGPYDDVGLDGLPGRVVDVPYRQQAFGPDCFSTELTTSSTCFVFIINAQLVDGKSVVDHPTDPTLHRDIFWSQWGFCVELAPDINVETPSSYDGSDLLKSDTANNGLGYYRFNWPLKFKKAKIPDLALAGRPEMTGTFMSMDTNCSTLKTKSSKGTFARTSAAKKWADYRGVNETDAPAYYTAPSQVTKRVVVRALWNQNQSTGR